MENKLLMVQIKLYTLQKHHSPSRIPSTNNCSYNQNILYNFKSSMPCRSFVYRHLNYNLKVYFSKDYRIPTRYHLTDNIICICSSCTERSRICFHQCISSCMLHLATVSCGVHIHNSLKWQLD